MVENFEFEERFREEITDEKIEKAAKTLYKDLCYLRQITDLFLRTTLSDEQYEYVSRLNKFGDDWQIPFNQFFFNLSAKFDSVIVLEKALKRRYYLKLIDKIEEIIKDEQQLKRLYEKCFLRLGAFE
ncbi:hypothetical protein P9850_12170 [Anoxybacillus rupiensis]|uniref:Uncharacterized protein n=1 Tax=Anoxybacteroides rupiense TaxID=311460 RepID=A0ABD5IXL0_9BACL|nr:hypothetical protein [Anoxybacillus rupiensis]